MLRVVTVLTTLSAFTQAVLAGGLVAGRIDALPPHSNNGLILGGATLLLGCVLILVWRPGRGPWWVLLAAAALSFATVVQTGVGFARILAVHVPLGVAVIVAQVLLLAWAWRRPQQ